MGLGIIISGVFILRVKPNAKFVAGWIACAAALYAIGTLNRKISYFRSKYFVSSQTIVLECLIRL